MVPGKALSKDPRVTVKANSEKCWLFVKVEASDNLSQFVAYQINTGENDWTALEGVSGVYYRTVEASTADQTFSVLAGGTTSSDPSETAELGEKSSAREARGGKRGVERADRRRLPHAHLHRLRGAVRRGFEDNPAAAWAQITSANTTTTTVTPHP